MLAHRTWFFSLAPRRGKNTLTHNDAAASLYANASACSSCALQVHLTLRHRRVRSVFLKSTAQAELATTTASLHIYYNVLAASLADAFKGVLRVY